MKTGRFVAGPAAFLSRLSDPLIWQGGDWMVRGNMPAISLGQDGVILGTLFRRGDDLPLLRLSEAERHAIRDGGPAWLIRHVWGAYDAVLKDGAGRWGVLRDPSGMLPCYTVPAYGGALFGNDARSLFEAAGYPGSIAPDRLARFLAGVELPFETCLADLDEILPGTFCSSLASAAQSCWHPAQFARGNSRASGTSAAVLARIVDRCVTAWAREAGQGIIGLSGGLDSSIVAALAAPHMALEAFTMVGPDQAGDERAFARLIADALALPLEPFFYKDCPIDPGQPMLAHLPRPVAGLFFQAISSAHAALGAEAPVLMAGNGGDHVFCTVRSAAPLVDRWRLEGPVPGLAATATDLARLTGVSVPAIVAEALRIAQLPAERPSGRADRTGLAELPDAWFEPSLHPWLQGLPDLPGKRRHVVQLIQAGFAKELYRQGSSLLQLTPLLSQPIVEYCLQVPSWMWIAGGVDRSLARRAFEARLPPAIIDRRSKGGPDGFMQAYGKAHWQSLGDRLIGGCLDGLGLVERAWCRAPLEAGPGMRAQVDRRLRLVAAEAWAAAWSAPSIGADHASRSARIRPPE
ncbi:asparagine synthase-related protein [Sphingomonas sp. FW199]|uniref:asparagine synthase-related protein n=1 Tax=Sphingomonas sp. FW199 TaxID=3400217 RepID=UPI003CEC45F4